jgi:hypothetical protein
MARWFISLQLPFLLLLAVLTGCTSTEVVNFQRVQGASVDEAYLQPGADFSRYIRLYPYPLEIYYREGEGAPSADDLERIRSIFRDAFLTELAGDYEIIEQPAKDALGVRASLVDLQNIPVGIDVPVDGRLRSLVANGKLTFLMELSDSSTGEVLARAADRDRSTMRNSDAGESSSWKQVDAAATYWAGLFRSFLDENLGKQ